MTTTTATQSPTNTEIDAAAAKRLLDAGGAVLIDVREPDEYAGERIDGAKLVPLSRFDPSQVPQGQKVVFQCHSGRRSLDALKRFRAVSTAEAYSLKGGIVDWKKSGLPIIAGASKAPISLLRQMQIVAGSMVLLGTLLGVFVSPWLLILSGFFGAGLLFSGASGTCPMISMLALIPWNKGASGTTC